LVRLWNFLFIVLAFFATTVASAFTGYQSYISRDTENRQLRAYVNISTIEFKAFRLGEPISAEFKIRNFGQTPAYNVRHWASIWVQPYPFPGHVPFAPDNGSHPSAPLSPSDDVKGVAIYDPVAGKPTILNQAAIDQFKSGTLAAYIVGTIAYDDVFGSHHVTRFCSYSGGEIKTWDGGVAIYREGNDAN
jgi:hypothetical protein